MKHVEDPQDELPLIRGAARIEIPLEQIRALRTPGAALDLAIRAAMLEPKEVYLALEIDAGSFSKMKDDKATFPADRIRELCDLLQNRIYVEWINSQIGCTAVLLKSEAERRAEEAEAAARTLSAENRLMRELLQAQGRLNP